MTEINIEKLKEIIEDEDIVEDKDSERLKELKNKIGSSRIVFARLFLECFDILGNNLYLFKEEESNVKSYLSEFKVTAIRTLLEEFGEGKLGTYFTKEKINSIIDSNREKMNGLIQTFFKLFSEED